MKGWLASGAVGGLALTVEFTLFIAVMQIQTEGISVDFLAVAPISLFVAAPLFLLGVGVIGLPAMMVIEGTGQRSAPVAAALGTVLAVAVATLLIIATGGSASGAPLVAALFLALPGAAAGWTPHRVAYGPSRKA